MGRSHAPAAAAGWLTCCLALNVGAGMTGHDPVINPLVALAGAVVTDSFAAGRNSPDMDLWLPFVRHRGVTHEVRTLLVLTGLSVLVVGALQASPWWPPFGAAWLLMAPVSGWWWHVAADRAWSALGLRTGGLVEVGRIRSPRKGAPGRGIRVLPFAPATLALELSAGALAVLVTLQWMAAAGLT